MMVSVQIDASLRARIPGITFGCVTINGVQVRERDEKLWGTIEQLCQRLASEYTLGQVECGQPCLSSAWDAKSLWF